MSSDNLLSLSSLQDTNCQNKVARLLHSLLPSPILWFNMKILVGYQLLEPLLGNLMDPPKPNHLAFLCFTPPYNHFHTYPYEIFLLPSPCFTSTLQSFPCIYSWNLFAVFKFHQWSSAFIWEVIEFQKMIQKSV